MKKVVLCILDGVGIGKKGYGNAVYEANMLFFKSLFNKYPYSLLEASGTHVGLPENIIGNSEVGHLNIGSGRIVKMPATFISDSIKNKEIYHNEILSNFLNECKQNNKNLHIIGLVSDAGVHSIVSHIFPIIEMAKKNNIENIYIHGISDGRDTNPNSGIDYFTNLEKELVKYEGVKLATVCGRFYAMDRDNRWDRTKRAFELLVDASGTNFNSLEELFNENYSKGITDEFIEPSILVQNANIKEDDYVIDFNFRPDRLRQLLSSLSNPKFNNFKRSISKVNLLTMMKVPDEVICHNIFAPIMIENPLGVYLSKLGKKQLRIAETEKYAHVTYFFDGGTDINLPKEKRILIPSPKVKIYDETPYMSAEEITENLIRELDNDYDFIVVNYANGDMLGHTGNYEKTIESLEFLDMCLSALYNKVKETEAEFIVTADHGNAEYMVDKNGEKVTNHTTNKVPFIICSDKYDLKNGSLKDIAPTVLDIMGEIKPKEMTGKTLITKKR